MGSTGKKSNPSNYSQLDEYLGERDSSLDISKLLKSKKNIINPNGHLDNCALCVTAFALNALGYDVKANPKSKDWRGPDSVFDIDYSDSDNFMIPSSFAGPNLSGFKTIPQVRNEYNNFDIDKTSMDGPENVAKQVIDKVKNWNDGAVGVLGVKWKDTGKGHIINVINQKGKAVVYDPQSNKVVSDLSSYLAKTESSLTSLARLDNAKIKNIDKKDLYKIVSKRKK